MKFFSSVYNVGYPVYGAKFLNDTMLLVAGGGGEGNNGIPNKLTVLRIAFDKKKIVKRFREITLQPNDDSPTTLDVAKDTILMGCNENSESIKNGEGNQHLRKFVYENEHLRFVASIDFDGSKTPEDYTKLIYLSKDGTVGAIASSKLPTIIRIIDPRDLTEKYEIETGHDVKDMHFAPDGKVISYITATTLEVISIVTGRFIIRKTDFDKNLILSKMRFLTDNTIVIAASLKKGSGIVMIKISLKSGTATVLKSKIITNKFKGVTSMDVDAKNQLAVLAGNDNSIALVKLNDLSLGKLLKNVHNFAITRVTFSPDSQLVASVSAANTVHVIKIPQNFALSTPIWKKICTFFTNFVLIVLIGILGHYFYKYDLHSKTFGFLKDQYIARRNRNSTINDIFKQTTLVGDVISTPIVDNPSSIIGGSSTVASEFAYTPSNEHDPITASAEPWSTLENYSMASTSSTLEIVNSTPPVVQSSAVIEDLSMSGEIMSKISSSSEASFTDTNHLPLTESTGIFQSPSYEVVASANPTSVSSLGTEKVLTANAVSENTYNHVQKPESASVSDTASNHMSISLASISSEQILNVGSTLSSSQDLSFVQPETAPRTKGSSFKPQIMTKVQDPSLTRIDSASGEYSTQTATSDVHENFITSLSSRTKKVSSESASPVADAVHTPVEESVPVPPQLGSSKLLKSSSVIGEVPTSTFTSSDVDSIQRSVSEILASDYSEFEQAPQQPKSETLFESVSSTSISASPVATTTCNSKSTEPSLSEHFELSSLSSSQVLTSTSLSPTPVSSVSLIVESEINQEPSTDFSTTAPLHSDKSKLEFKKSELSETANTVPSSMSTSTDRIRSKAPEMEEPVPEEFAPPEPRTQNTKEHVSGDHPRESLSVSPDPTSLVAEGIHSTALDEDNRQSSTEDAVRSGSSVDSGITPKNENEQNLSPHMDDITITRRAEASLSSTQTVNAIDSKMTSDIVFPEETPSPKLADETSDEAWHDEL